MWLCIKQQQQQQQQYDGIVFLYAAIIFPPWSYFSFKVVSEESTPLSHLLIGFVLVESAHLGVLVWVIRKGHVLSSSLHMILMIASGLFLSETAAFVGVVTCMGRRPPPPPPLSTRRDSNGEYQDLSPPFV